MAILPFSRIWVDEQIAQKLTSLVSFVPDSDCHHIGMPSLDGLIWIRENHKAKSE